MSSRLVNPPSPRAHAPSSPPGVKSSPGLPVGKLALGCGCVGLLAVLGVTAVLGVGGLFVFNEVKDSGVLEQGKQKLEEIKELEQASSGVAGAKSEEVGSTAKAMSSLSKEEMLGWTARPLTAQDVAQHESFMTSWSGSSAVKQSLESREALVEGSKKKKEERGALDELKMLNASKNLVLSTGKAYEEMDALAKQHGGAEEVMRRYFQVVAVASAARAVAQSDEIEAITSDEVAAKMLKEHQKWGAEYTRWRKVNTEYFRVMLSAQSDPKRLEALGKDPDFQKQTEAQQEITKLQNEQPGYLLLGKIPRASLETWKGLGEARRAKLLDTYGTIPFLPLYMFAPDQLQNLELMSTQLVALEYASIMSELAEQETAAPAAK